MDSGDYKRWNLGSYYLDTESLVKRFRHVDDAAKAAARFAPAFVREHFKK